MKKNLILLIPLLIVLLIGYLSSESSLNLLTEKISFKEEKDMKLTNVWVYGYLSNTKKAQPELILLIHDSTELIKLTNWINGRITTLPSNLNIKSIYILDFEYSVNDKVTNHRYFMYLESANELYYIKEIVNMKEYYYEEYDDAMNDQLIKKIGTDNWCEVTKGPFYD